MLLREGNKIINVSEESLSFLKDREGLVSANETSYDKLLNYHIKNGFCILTAFRSENTLSQNRALNKKLKDDLKAKNLGFITVVGGYRETITKDNLNWDDADPIKGKDDVRLFSSTESSLLVPNYNTKTKEPFDDFKELSDYIISLGTKYDQDAVLIAPPNGKAYYVITTDREGLSEGSKVGSIDMQFDSMGLAGIADAYFTSLTKTVGKMKAQGHGNAFKFENYIGSYVLKPLGTIAGAHCRDLSGELPIFGSHLISHSTYATEAKARNVKKVKAALTGKNDLIKTWGIITAENPLGIEDYPDEVNTQRDRDLRSKLAQSNLEYIKVKGKYGNPENSLFLINPAFSDMVKLATEFGQESFIFATNSHDGDFSFDAGYYEMDTPESLKRKYKEKLKKDPSYKIIPQPKYKKSITKDRIINQKDADDFFTSIQTLGKKFKFQIPFFESTIKNAFDRVQMCIEGKDLEDVKFKILKTTLEADDYTPGSRWRNRGLLYKARQG